MHQPTHRTPDLADTDIFATPAEWTTTPVTARADYKKKPGSSDTNHTYDTTAV